MIGLRAAAGVALCLSLFAQPVHADVDVADYGTAERAGSAKEQARTREMIEAERKLEAARERAEQDALERQARQQRMLHEARPYAERLTEARCTRCHVAEHYLEQRHSWLGWTLVSLRMKYLNEASEISEAERVVIVNTLASMRQAPPGGACLEYLVALAAIAALPLAGWTARRLRRRQ